jgi:hypothetical protein
MFKGDVDALDLAAMVCEISHVWDDLIDKDKPVSDDQINRAFWLALIAIPGNPFYARFGDTLRPVMATGILNWIAANALEKRGGEHEMQIAHVTRYSVADVLMLIATLIGGQQWGFEAAADIRLMCQKNTLRDYLKEHNHAA